MEDNLADYIANRAIVAHPYSEQPFSQYLQQQPSILPSLVCIGSEGGWIDYGGGATCQTRLRGSEYRPTYFTHRGRRERHFRALAIMRQWLYEGTPSILKVYLNFKHFREAVNCYFTVF